MSTAPIREITRIRAPLARCFALSTQVELVQRTLGMRPVGGVTRGRVGAGSRVHWRGWKFGFPTSHHTLITGYAAPQQAGGLGELRGEDAGQWVAWFRDTQERGRFASFQHDHFFREALGADAFVVTTLEDEVHFALPFGLLGRLVAKWALAPYIRKLTRQRFAMLTELAEGKGWKKWLDDAESPRDGPHLTR